MSRLTVSLVALVLCAAMFYSCSKDDSPDNGEMMTVKGVLTSPNGETPISGATVFISKEDISTIETSVSPNLRQVKTNNSDECPTPPIPNLGFTCTESDGSFELSFPTGGNTSVVVVFQSSVFTFTQEILLSDESNIDLGVVEMEPAAANIAVVTGSFDSMQDILAKLGFGEVNAYGKLILGTEVFDMYDGDFTLQYEDRDYPLMSELFEDTNGDGKIELHNYDIVFINCGASESAVSPYTIDSRRSFSHDDYHRHGLGKTTLSQEAVNEIKTFVNNGGTLYCTDWAYSFVEQTFPEMIDFYGSDGTPANLPEEWSVAKVGQDGIEVAGEILDSSLSSWMSGVTCNEGDCLESDGTVHITSFLGGWVKMNGPHEGANLFTWIQGEVEGVSIPLTVSFDSGSGKVVYSSYHTLHGSSMQGWFPQERVLQYLVFK